MKTIFVILHGKSCEELEKRIEEFKNFDLVWCSMSSFDVPQEYILNKIDKHFKIVFDCSTVQNAEHYELTRRIPRISNHLDKYLDSIYISTRTDKNNTHDLRQRIAPEFLEKYKNRIIYTEDIGIDPNPFCVSLHLYIACLCKLGYEEIILFGADGGGQYGNAIESYYKWEEVKKDKEIAQNLDYNMIGDTHNINSTYKTMMLQSLGYNPKVINVSSNSLYTFAPKVDYDEILKYLKQ